MASLLKCFSVFSLVFIAAMTLANASEPAPKFKKIKAKIGAKQVTLEVADTPEKLSYGLMYREKLEKDSGMLFVFEKEEFRHFWMKNTFLDLSIGFFNAKKELVDVQEMSRMKSVMDQDVNTYVSAKPALFAVEMTKGWFSKNKIKPGSKLDISQ